MSSKPNKKGAKQQRDAGSSDIYGMDDQGAVDQDRQPTPAHGFPAVPADEPRSNDRARSDRGASVKKDETANYDFLWESTETKRSAKGEAGTTTVVESDTDYLLLPHPDVFNAYPPEVQRKITEWADRDVRARRDDESLRQDALIRAQAARERMIMAVPVAIIILCIVCAAVTGLYTKSAVFAVAFLVVAAAVILALTSPGRTTFMLIPSR